MPSKSKTIVFALGLLLASNCVYAQKGKNIAKGLRESISRRAARAGTSARPTRPGPSLVARTPEVTLPSSVLATPTMPNLTMPAVSALERLEKAVADMPSVFPSPSVRARFVERWDAMTPEEQMTDWKEFQKYYENEYWHVEKEARNQFLQERNMRHSALTDEQKEISEAMSIAERATTPQAFETSMEYFLVEGTPQMRAYLDEMRWASSGPMKQLISNRVQVLERAGKEGVEHPVTAQEQTEYALAIREMLDPAIRMDERLRSLWYEGDAVQNSLSEASRIIESYNMPIVIGGQAPTIPAFVNRATGDLGLVFELPAPMIIGDGINPAQMVDPQTQVIFFAADPMAKRVIYVEERAKFEDPYAYNLVSPRVAPMAAEQPMPAHAGRPADPEAYAQIRNKVVKYREQYYDNK